MGNKVGLLVLIVFALAQISFATINFSLADEGTDVRDISTGNLVTGGTLVISLYNTSTGGGAFWTQTYTGVINGGSWNVMMDNIPLSYGTQYWKDYTINGDDINFSGNDRVSWYSPLGDINYSFISNAPVTMDHAILSNLEWSVSGHWLANNTPIYFDDSNVSYIVYNTTTGMFEFSQPINGTFIGDGSGLTNLNISAADHSTLSNLQWNVSGHWVGDNEWIYLNTANTSGIRFANATAAPPTGQIEVNWKFYAPNIYSGNTVTGQTMYTNYLVMGNPAYSPGVAGNYFYMINPDTLKLSFSMAKTGAMTMWQAQNGNSYIIWKDNSSPTEYTLAGIGVYNNSGVAELEIYTLNGATDPIQMYSTTNLWENTAIQDSKYLFFDTARSKSLWYDPTDTRFEFNDTLFVDGDINTSSRMIINDTNIQDGMLWISSGDDVNVSNRERMIMVQTNTSNVGNEITRFIVLGDGTTGINTATPNDMLDVNGDILLSGIATIGSRYVYADSAGYMGNNLTIQAGYGGCFPADMVVKTPTGDRRVDELEVGELVSSYNTDTSTSTTSRVEHIENLTQPGYYLINGGIKATAEHPFWTKTGWIAAENLTTSDELFDGTSWVAITSVAYVSGNVNVYKIEVGKPNTYFVNGVLVHNKSPTPRPGGDLYLAGGYGSYGAADGDVYLCADTTGSIGYCYVESDLTVNGDVYANYFIGDGSQLTNITGQYWNRTGTTLEPATDGDKIYSTGNLTMKTWNRICLDTSETVCFFYNSTHGYIDSGNNAWSYASLVAQQIQLHDGLGNSSDIYYNGTNFEFSDNVAVYGNVSADYFIGNGSLLYDVNYTETDPLWSGNDTSVARIGNCPSGQVVVNTTTSGVQCIIPPSGIEIDPLWSGNYSLVAFLSDQANWNVNSSVYTTNATYAITANSSNYWDGLNTPAEIGHNQLLNLSWSVANHTIDTDFAPATNDTYNLGNATHQWKDMNLTGNITNGGYINATTWVDGANFSINDVPIIATNRSIAWAETANHTIGTFNFTSFSGLNMTIGNSTGNMTYTPTGYTSYGTARHIKCTTLSGNQAYGYASTYNGIACTASALSILSARWLGRTFGDGSGANVCDASLWQYVLPSDYENGTTISFRISWTSAATTGNVAWGLGVTAVGAGESMTAASTYYTATPTKTGAAWDLMATTIIDGGTGYEKGDNVQVVLYRHGDAGGDTMAGDVLVTQVCMLYTSNTLGAPV